MFCPYCGKEISENSQFCTYCGRTLQDAGSPAGSAQSPGPAEPFEAGPAEPFEAGPAEPFAQGPVRTPGLSPGARIGIIAAAVAAAAFLLVFFLFPGSPGRKLLPGGGSDASSASVSGLSAGQQGADSKDGENKSESVSGGQSENSMSASTGNQAASAVSGADAQSADQDASNGSAALKAEPVLLTPENITASSELAPYSNYTYYASHIDDRNLETAWNEGADGPGIGEYLELSFPAGTELTGGIIFPAYYKNKDIFYKNNAPTRLSFSSGGEVRELDTSESASSYQADFSGQEFTFDEPLTCDGTLRVTILDVRKGNTYDDACISELQMRGRMPGGNSDGNAVSGDEGGAYGYFYEEDLWKMTSMPGHLFNYMEWTRGSEVSGIRAGSLTPQEKAFMLYWYQYNCTDSRIREEGEYNSASIADMRKIMEELCVNVTDEDFTKFREEFVDHTEGDRCFMPATGDFGDAGNYYLGEAESSSFSGGRLEIRGHVMRYDQGAEEYRADQPYCLYYVPKEGGLFGGFIFEEMRLGDDSGEKGGSPQSQKQTFDLTNGILQVSSLEGTIFLFEGENATGEMEQCVGLRLDAPVHISSEYTGETDITEIQLGDDRGGSGPGLESMNGNRVRVSGEAFAAHTAHHHRDMVVMVKTLEKI